MKKKLLGIACVFTPVIGFGQAFDQSNEIKFLIDKNVYENGTFAKLDEILRVKSTVEEKDGSLILTFDSHELESFNTSAGNESVYDIIFELEKLGVLKYENNGHDTACNPR